MRHLKPDVSHRMRRRPSIFSARWFRLILGGGVIVIVGLLLGPPVAGWLRAGPRTAPVSRAVTLSAPQTASPGLPVAAVTPRPTLPRAAPETPPPPAAADTGVKSAAATPAATAPAPPTTAGSAVFRIQMGAFLDHRNADRLTDRLRAEGLEVVTSIIEESRTTYRVLATPAEGDGYGTLVQRLRDLGYTPELTDAAAAVTQPMPLAAAVETSRRLREQGIPVRLERRPSTAAFRVVRAGAFATAEEAERKRAELVARGYEGFVVREH